MYILLRSKFLIWTNILLAIYFQEAECDQNGPGVSSCIYYGMVAEYSCYTTAVPLDKLPDCTSFVFESLGIDENHVVSQDFNDGYDAYLDMLGQSGKKLYVNFLRMHYDDWIKLMECVEENALKDAKGINAYTSNHPGITGLLLRRLEPYPNSEEYVGFTQKLLKYIETVKHETKLEIGININSNTFLKYYDYPYHAPWLNFTVLNPCIDFYVISLNTFYNNCTESLRNSPIPISGSEEHTLEKLKTAIQTSLIPKDKTYFAIVLGPKSDTNNDDACTTNYQTVCTSPKITKNWCADTQESFFKKGQWFRENGAGFIGSFVDFDDPQNCCNCGNYPSFNAILAGFNGSASVPTCPLYDRLV